MNARTPNGASRQPWMKFAALVLVLAALGLPVNDLPRIALLVVAVVLIVTGKVTRRRGRWLVALLVAGGCLLAQMFMPAPRIEEGHNVFLVDRARRRARNRTAAARLSGS